MNDLHFFSLASDHGISGIMPVEVSQTTIIKGDYFLREVNSNEYTFNKHAIRIRKSIIIKVFELFYYVGKQKKQ